ncbi:MAG: hypothetical protein R8K48_06325 [Gallionella sp.]
MLFKNRVRVAYKWMRKIALLLLLTIIRHVAWADSLNHGLHIDVKRNGRVYVYSAQFDTSLTRCSAYRYLTDYAAKKELPGVVGLSVSRESSDTVNVNITADEPILFFTVRINAVLIYTEKPFNSVAFKQKTGNSIIFKGKWDIIPTLQGSTLLYKGFWEPNTVVPFVILDQFAKNILVNKFTAIAEQADRYKSFSPATCVD